MRPQYQGLCNRGYYLSFGYCEKSPAFRDLGPTLPVAWLFFVPMREQDKDLDFPLSSCRAYRAGFALKDAANAEAYVVVAVRRIVVVPIRNGAVIGIVIEVTASFHTVGTAC